MWGGEWCQRSSKSTSVIREAEAEDLRCQNRRVRWGWSDCFEDADWVWERVMSSHSTYSPSVLLNILSVAGPCCHPAGRRSRCWRSAARWRSSAICWNAFPAWRRTVLIFHPIRRMGRSMNQMKKNRSRSANKDMGGMRSVYVFASECGNDYIKDYCPGET